MGSIRQQIMILMLQSGILEVTLHACPTAAYHDRPLF